MQTVHNVGDLVTFFDDNNQETLGIIIGNTKWGTYLRVSTLQGQLYKRTPDQVIITMGNYFDGPQTQKNLRTIAHIRQ